MDLQATCCCWASYLTAMCPHKGGWQIFWTYDDDDDEDDDDDDDDDEMNDAVLSVRLPPSLVGESRIFGVPKTLVPE
eukprot:4555767-Karenia_brevis.AAC.1